MPHFSHWQLKLGQTRKDGINFYSFLSCRYHIQPSGNPIQITKSGIDYDTLINSSSFQTRSNAAKKATEDGKINVNSAVEYLIENEKALDSLTYNNEFDENYISYLLSMPNIIMPFQ